MARRLNTKLIAYLVVFLGPALIAAVVGIGVRIRGDQAGDPLALLAEAEEYRQEGELQRAFLTLQRAAKADQENIEILYELHEVALLQEPQPFVTAARSALERILALDPQNFEARRDLAGLYVFLPARRVSEGVLWPRDGGVPLEALFPLSRRRGMWQSNNRAAMQAVDALIQLKPDYGLGHLWGALIQLHIGDDKPLKADKNVHYENVIRRCEAGLEHAPDMIDLYRLMALAGNRLEYEEEKVLEITDRAVAAKPGAAEAYLLKASWLERFDRRDEAVEVLSTGLEQAGEDPRLYRALGEIEVRRRRVEVAAAHLRKAIELDPEQERSYLLLARLYTIEGDSERRAEVLEQGRRALPESERLTFEQADAYLDLKEFEKAQALIAELDDGEDETGRVSYLRGKYALIQNQLRQAITHLLRAREKNPTPMARMLLGQAYLRSDELGAAADELEELLLVTPGLVRARAMLADIHFRLRRYEDAVREADAILANNPAHVGMRMLKARALAALDRTGPALREAQLAADRAPSNPQPFLVLASIQRSAGLDSEAERSLLQAKELATGQDQRLARLSAYRSLAAIYRATDQTEKLQALMSEAAEEFPDAAIVSESPEQAEQRLRRRLQDDPSHVNRLLLAELLFRTGRAEEALPLLDAVIDDADPSSREWLRAWRQAFTVHLTGGDYDACVRLTEMLREARPEAPELAFADPLMAIQQNQLQKAAEQILATVETLPSSSLYFLLGQVRLRQGRTEDAQLALRRCLEVRPQFVPARQLLGRIMVREGNYSAALIEAREGLRQDEDNLPLMELQAVAYAGLGRLRRAAEVREMIAEAVPSNVGNLLGLASLYRRIERPRDAEARLQQAYARRPDDPRVVRSFADFYATTDRLTQGRALIDRYVADHDESVQAHLMRAAFVAAHVGTEEAESHYRRAFNLNPDDPRPLVLFGERLVQARRWGKAEEVFQEVVSSFPDDMTSRKRLAEVHRLQRDFDEAERIIDEVLRRAPEDASAMVIRGRIAAQRRNEEVALEYFEKAAETAPDYGEASYWKAVLIQESRPSEALTLLGEIEPADAAFEKAVLRRARMNASAGRNEQAIIDLRRGLDFRPQSPLIRRALAMRYMATGQHLKAADEWQALLRQRVDAQLLVQLGRALYLAGRYGPALERYEQAREMAPESAQALVGEASCLVALDRQEEALRRTYAVMEKYDKKAWPRLALSQIYELMGEYDEALAALSNSLIDEPSWEAGYLRQAEILARLAARLQGADQEQQLERLRERRRRVLTSGLDQLPGSIALRIQLGALETESDRPEAAVAVLKPVAEQFEQRYSLMPEDLQTLRRYIPGVRLYALGLYHLGEIDEAIRWSRMIWRLDPTDFANANNLAWMLAVEKNELEEAENLMSRALQLLRHNPQVLDTAGVIAYLKEEYQEAMEYFRESLNRGESAAAHYHLGWVYEAREQPALARERYEKALELGLPAKEAEECRERLQGLPEMP